MHFAVLTGYGAIGLQYHGGIVVDAGGAALKEGKHNDYAQFLGQGSETIGGGAWNGLCQVTEPGVFLLAEVEAVVQLLQHNQLGPLGSDFAHVALQSGDISGNVGRAVLLHHAYFQFSHYLYWENFCNSFSALILSMMAQTRWKVRLSLV